MLEYWYYVYGKMWGKAARIPTTWLRSHREYVGVSPHTSEKMAMDRGCIETIEDKSWQHLKDCPDVGTWRQEEATFLRNTYYLSFFLQFKTTDVHVNEDACNFQIEGNFLAQLFLIIHYKWAAVFPLIVLRTGVQYKCKKSIYFCFTSIQFTHCTLL